MKAATKQAMKTATEQAMNAATEQAMKAATEQAMNANEGRNGLEGARGGYMAPFF